MKNYEYETLNERRWATPDSYGGFDPIGDVVIAVQSRDSDCLERSNYSELMRHLEKFSKTLKTDNDEPFIYDFRAGHWAVGWVETLLMRQNAPDKLQMEIVSCLDALTNYPVFNEDHYSELEHEEIQSFWESMSIAERVKLIQKYGGSIFAARANYLSENADPDGMIFDHLRAP